MTLLVLLAIILVSYASFAIEAKYLPVKVAHTKYGMEIKPIRNHKEYAIASAIIESDMFLEPRSGDTASQIERVSRRLKAKMNAVDVLYVPTVLFDIYALQALSYGDEFAYKEHNYNVYVGLLNYLSNAAKDVSPDKQILLHSTFYADEDLRSVSDFHVLIRNFLAKFTVKGGYPRYLQNEITNFYTCLENIRACHNSAIHNSILHEYQAAFDNDKYLVYLPSTDPTESGFKTSGVDILLEDEEHKLFKTWFSFKTKYPSLNPISLHLWPGEIPRGAVKDRGLFYEVKLEVLDRSDDTVFSMENFFSAIVSAEYWPVKLDIFNDSARFIPLDNVLAFERAKIATELDVFQHAPLSSSTRHIVRIYEKIKSISDQMILMLFGSRLRHMLRTWSLSNPTVNKAKARLDYRTNRSFTRYLDNREGDFGSNRIQYTRFGEGSVSALEFVPILKFFFRSIQTNNKICLDYEKKKLYKCGIDLANNCLEKCNSCEESQIYRSMISEGLAAFQDDNYVVYYPYRSGSYRSYGLSALKDPETNLLYKTFIMMKQVPQYALVDAKHVFVSPGEIESI